VELSLETNNIEVESTEKGKAEPVATEEHKVTEEPEKDSQETSGEAEKPNTIPIVEPSAEANEEKATEKMLEEAINNEVDATEKGKTESLVTEVEPTETGKEDQEEPEQLSTETNDVVAVEEKTRELELEAAPLKETNIDEVVPTETEKAEPVVTVVDENQSELGIQSIKQKEEEKPKEEAEIQEQTVDTVEVHPPKDSDIEVVKEIDNSESEVIPIKEENTDPVSNGVVEKPIEPLQVGEEVVETIKEQATEKSEGSLNDTIKKEESETNTAVNTAEVSLNEEAQTNPADIVEPSPEVEEKVVVEDGKKESSFTDVIEEISSKEVVGVTENTTSVEEKAVVAAEDVKKEPEALNAVQVSSREAEVDIKKTDEQNEAKTATPEAGDADKKVDEIFKAVSEPVRETLASKFEEKDEEETIQTGADNSEKERIEEPVKTEVEATKENDTTTITSKDLPKETPAKPPQKQSNNIISKVKQSLVKAKKAITGKSPSKNLSSDPKGDIKVK
jgi:hypothetical protein